MKVTLRIPTNDQFAFIEIEKEVIDTMEAVDAYNEAMGHFKPNEGLPHKEWNSALDEYLTTNSLRGGTELYERMSLNQKMVMQEIKKAFKRITSKEE